MQYAPCGYISITHEGVIIEVNQTFLDMMGYTRVDLVQQHIESIMSIPNKLMFHTYFYPFINLNGHVDEMFLTLKDSQGHALPFLLNGRRLESEGIEVIDCILVRMTKRIDYELELRNAKKQIEEAYWEKDQALVKLEQIYLEIEQKQEELIALNANLMELSVTDKLTGLKNRRFFQQNLEEQMIHCSKQEQPFSIFMIDIDHFKTVNDTWGHQMGDYVLEEISNILRNHVRQGDVVARYGGEEFVFILPKTDVAESKRIAEILRLAVAGSTWKTGTITISIGIATYTPMDSDTTILQKADHALYVSKENGRNQVTHSIDLT